MEMVINMEGTIATIALDGKLSVATSPELDHALAELPADTTEIDLDLTNLTYISSAGLRVLVAADKQMTEKGGGMKLLHPNDDVMDVFEITGLSEIFTIAR